MLMSDVGVFEGLMVIFVAESEPQRHINFLQPLTLKPKFGKVHLCKKIEVKCYTF